MSAVTIVFGLLILSLAISALLMTRFLKLLHSGGSMSDSEIEGLSQLLLSGSGGVRAQTRALGYLLGRKYAGLPDKGAVRAGDYTLASWWVSVTMLIALAVAMSVH